MTKVSFITPVTYGDLPKTSVENDIEKYDSYFNVTGWSARIIDKDTLQAEWHYERPKIINTVLKVLSYFTLIVPFIVLGLKYSARAQHQFFFRVEPAQKEEKVSDIVNRLLKENKFEEAKHAVSSSDDSSIEVLKQKIADAEAKFTITKNIEKSDFDAVYTFLKNMETGSTKDEYLGMAIDALLKKKTEEAFKFTELSYFCDEMQLQHKYKIVAALIEAGGSYKEHLKSFPKGNKKDALLEKALLKAIKDLNTVDLDLFSEPFQDYRLRVSLIRKTFDMLTESTAGDILAVLKIPSLHKMDALVTEFMDLLCNFKFFDTAKNALTIKSLGMNTRIDIHGTLAAALIHSYQPEEGIEIIKVVFSDFAAKEAVIKVIKALKEKEMYAEFVDLITENPSIHLSEYIEKFLNNASSETFNRFEIAEILLEKELFNHMIKLIEPVLLKDLLLAENSLVKLVNNLFVKERYEEVFYIMGSYEFWGRETIKELLIAFANKFEIKFEPKSKTLEMDLRKAISLKLESMELKEAAKKIYPF